MKKGLMLVAILLFIGSGFAMVYAYDRYASASSYKMLAEKEMSEIKATQDMARIETLSTYLKQDLVGAGKATQMAEIGFGAGAVLLIASVICFFKAKKPKVKAKAV